MPTALLDDELWKLIEPLVPARKRRFRHPGRDCRTLAGILFVLRTEQARAYVERVVPLGVWHTKANAVVRGAPVRRRPPAGRRRRAGKSRGLPGVSLR